TTDQIAPARSRNAVAWFFESEVTLSKTIARLHSPCGYHALLEDALHVAIGGEVTLIHRVAQHRGNRLNAGAEQLELGRLHRIGRVGAVHQLREREMLFDHGGAERRRGNRGGKTGCVVGEADGQIPALYHLSKHVEANALIGTRIDRTALKNGDRPP